LKADADSQNQQPGRVTPVIASPNPTIKEAAPAGDATTAVTATKVEGAATTKPAATNKKTRRRRSPTRPRND